MLPATFRQLETFVLVAETGSFAAAADTLGVSSAAISGHVGALESKLGCELFARRPGTTPVLTERGVGLLQQARELVDQAAAMASAAGAPRRPEPRARVGAGPFILEQIILPRMAEFQAAHPQIQVEFFRIAPNSVFEVLARERLDLAYVSTYRDLSPTAELISTAGQGLFVRPDHPIVAAWPGAPLPMIMPLSGSTMERAVQSTLVTAGISDFIVVTRAQHHETIMQLAEQGLGVCCAFHDAVAAALAAGRLVELDAALPPLRRWAARRPGALQVDHLRHLDAFFAGLLRAQPAGSQAMG